MEKINQYCSGSCIYYICLLPLVFSPFSLRGEDSQSYFFVEQIDSEEVIDYEGLGEYENMFREFEIRSEEEFVSKGLSPKKWFKHSVVNLFKKLVSYKKFKSGEQCAYEIAKFKRDVDKKLYNTGDIEDILKEFELGTNDPAYSGMESFKERIRYYYYNKHVIPPRSVLDKK